MGKIAQLLILGFRIFMSWLQSKISLYLNKLNFTGACISWPDEGRLCIQTIISLIIVLLLYTITNLLKHCIMKKYLLCIMIILTTTVVNAQVKNYNVVFDMSSKDSINQQAVIREINLIKDASPDAKLEVVIYGQGLDLAVKGRSVQQAAVQKIIAENKASFKVCAMTLQRNNIGKDQLVPGVEIVPDGIYEIITKQQERWGYIKVGH